MSRCARRHPGLAKWDIETCSAEQPDCRPPVHLWYARLHYMARFVDLGLNPMYMDTDLTAQANFYRCAAVNSSAGMRMLWAPTSCPLLV